jgi:hypothetical protein
METMKCPKCGENMTAGAIAVHGTFWGFLAAGWSIQHCWWQPGGDWRQAVKIVPSGRDRKAFRCEQCRFLIVPDV